ncbi:hypothetical protein HPP92_010420 [Vanilla planifolia]|uniref:Gustatory receptor n=1 Tax=Vanilla planifolia TaxID=51239 RepID=A0A835R545_VANPL|nr:hypothetical protein HPP92_010420 [Vanilla planifolia]
MVAEAAPLLAGDNDNFVDEILLHRFCAGLKWCALDHSSTTGRAVSYLAFLILTIAIPTAISVFLPLPSLSAGAAPFNDLSQLTASFLSSISFFTLSSTFRHRCGLRQLLLLDDILRDSAAVRRGHSRDIDRAFRYLAAILLPSFSVELAHKTLLFATSSAAPPWKAAAFAAALASWVYRTGVFLLVCVLFRVTCELQILRFEEFYKLFAGDGAASVVEEGIEVLMLGEHMRIRRQLKATSHRYRIFIIGSLVTMTISQLGSLLLLLATKADKNFCNSGDLVVSSIVQLSGYLMCLFGAARITHRAQRVISIASQWHSIMSSCSHTKLDPILDHDQSNGDHNSHGSIRPSIPTIHSTFESRQALVAYLQHNGGGITIFGYTLDRGLLHTLFAFETTLVLWILSKVVVLS